MEINTGIVTTNSACNGCNKCLTVCPIPGANISTSAAGGHRIEVNPERCINCGICITDCHNQAREALDDTELFFAELAAGKEFSLALDSAFKLLYPEELPHILGYLRTLGIKKIYDVSFGADIYTWATVAYYDEHPEAAMIATTCPVTIALIEKYYPELFPYLLPVKSPLMCLATYVRKYLHDETPLVYIGPCLAKIAEIKIASPEANLVYSVTFEKFFKKLSGYKFDNYYSRVDICSPDLGYLYGFSDGIKENLAYFMPPDFSILSVNGLGRGQKRSLDLYKEVLERKTIAPLLLNVRNGYLGCVDAPNVPEKGKRWTDVIAGIKGIREHILCRPDYEKGCRERVELLNTEFAELNLQDFKQVFVNRYRQESRLPEDVLEKIFVAMRKTTTASRKINCGTCGYATCRDMARAVAYGYNQIENCIHYAKNKTQQLTYTDLLTGLPNLNSFKQQTKELFWNHPEQQYVIVYFDIKNFKMINDLYGFAKGDQTLKAVAEQAYGFVWEKGTFARLMGDHFLLCMPDTKADLQTLINYIRENTNKFNLDFPISFDLGLYRVTDIEQPIENMIALARLAQLTIKGSYDVRWAYYDEAMREKMRREAWVTKEMRKALEEKQFQVYLQPQYDHLSKKMTGAEVLVRWIHPEKGIIEPAEFIPTFEKNNFIQELDAYVREKTCQLLQEWQKKGLPVVPLSVNLSRLELFNEHLPEELLKLIEALSPHMLNLEITESAYTQNPEQLIVMIKKLQQIGFLVEMDDFGSGYSSLNTLHEMPIDVIKLDLRFLTGEQRQKSKTIMENIAQMMQKLQLPVIAEGVETKEQADFLASIGCNIIQGYYYAKPMPATKFEELLRGQK